MQLTDEEIRAIILEERKRKRRKQKIKRRISLIICTIVVLALGIGIFVNRDARVEARGIIFLDPGHGGVDGGSTVGERYEKEDTLALSLLVRKDLEEMGYKVYMSREKDEDVDRKERGRMANNKKAQLMVSIHRNKADEGQGVEAFIPSGNDSSSRLLGENIIKKLVSLGYTERSVRAGTLVNANDDYYENSYSKMPSCLVEVGFIQDKGDNRIFDEKRDETAMAIAEGIDKTFSSLFEKDEE